MQQGIPLYGKSGEPTFTTVGFNKWKKVQEKFLKNEQCCINPTVRTFLFGTSLLRVQGLLLLPQSEETAERAKKATYCYGLHTYGYFCFVFA